MWQSGEGEWGFRRVLDRRTPFVMEHLLGVFHKTQELVSHWGFLSWKIARGGKQTFRRLILWYNVRWTGKRRAWVQAIQLSDWIKTQDKVERIGAPQSREWRAKTVFVGLWRDTEASEFLGLVGVWMSINQDFDYKGHKSTWASLSEKEGVFQGCFVKNWIHILESWQKGHYLSGLSFLLSSSYSSLSPHLCSPLLSLLSSLSSHSLSLLSFVEENDFPTVHEFTCYTKFAHHISSLIRNQFSISPS